MDLFTLEIIENGLIAAAEEMFVVWGRTAKSPVIYEVLDYGCGITDWRGELIAIAAGIPTFLGTLDLATREAIERHNPDGFEEGDIIISNVPYRSGTHLNDVTLIMPVFAGGRLLAFAASKGHWSEIGGMHFGSWSPSSTEIYQEGLQFPAVKLFRAGRPNVDLIDVIRQNVRTPDLTLGDMEGQIASVRVGAAAIGRLVSRYGVDAVREAMGRIWQRGRQQALAVLARMPHGTYVAEDWIDDDGITDDPLRVCVRVDLRPDGVTFDFTGSAPQARGPINSPFGGTISTSRVILKALLDPHSPATGGDFSVLTVVAPEGSIFNPRPPAPVATNWEGRSYVGDLVWKALCTALPDRLVAGNYNSVCATIVGGIDDRTGEPFAVVEPQPGGWGGGEGKDGESGMFYLGNGETYAMPVEVLEARTPIRFERYVLDREAARGAGRFRSGLGIVKEYRIVNSHAIFTASFGRSKFPAWGAAGGEGGSPNYFMVEKPGEPPRRLSKITALRLSGGDLIQMHTGSGGGFGDPLERDPERVAADGREGFVTAGRAQEVYGVVLTGDGRVDGPATAARRASLREQRSTGTS